MHRLRGEWGGDLAGQQVLENRLSEPKLLYRDHDIDNVQITGERVQLEEYTHG